MTLKTVLNKVIVEPVEAETVTKGGIIIPDTAQEKPQKGTVIATGKGKACLLYTSFIREAYRMPGIPRFMLVNPEGYLVNFKYTRPSDPQCAELDVYKRQGYDVEFQL